jgi:uncharacterized membrane protein (UPF0127 family)
VEIRTARRRVGFALEIPRCRSVHTFGMRFALDLVWLDAGGDVVRIDLGVRPCRVRSCRAARSVVEVPAGSDLSPVAGSFSPGAGEAAPPSRS